MRNEAWPIHVMATSPVFNFGNTGWCARPWRGVNHAFSTISLKNVRGLKCFAGVSSLKERGSLRRDGAPLDFAFAIEQSKPSTFLFRHQISFFVIGAPGTAPARFN